MTKTSFIVDIQMVKCNLFLDAFALYATPIRKKDNLEIYTLPT